MNVLSIACLKQINLDSVRQILHRSKLWAHSLFRFLNRIEKLLIPPLLILLVIEFSAILYFLFTMAIQKEFSALYEEISYLKSVNVVLRNGLIQQHGNILAPLTSTADTQHKRKESDAALVIDMRRFSYKDLPQLRLLLNNLYRHHISATFIFSSAFIKSDQPPKIFAQLKTLGHEIGYAEKIWEYAENNAPIMTSSARSPDKYQTHIMFDFSRRVDAKKASFSDLKGILQATKPNDIVLVDPLNPRAVKALSAVLSARPPIRMITVGELFRNRGSPPS